MMRRLIPFAGKEPFAREPRRPKEPVKLVKPAHGKREKVELVTGEVLLQRRPVGDGLEAAGRPPGRPSPDPRQGRGRSDPLHRGGGAWRRS
jgi:hypothetical protein